MEPGGHSNIVELRIRVNKTVKGRILAIVDVKGSIFDYVDMIKDINFEHQSLSI